MEYRDLTGKLSDGREWRAALKSHGGFTTGLPDDAVDPAEWIVTVNGKMIGALPVMAASPITAIEKAVRILLEEKGFPVD